MATSETPDRLCGKVSGLTMLIAINYMTSLVRPPSKFTVIKIVSVSFSFDDDLQIRILRFIMRFMRLKEHFTLNTLH